MADMKTVLVEELEEKVFDVLYKQEKFCEFVAQNSGTKSSTNFRQANAMLRGMLDLACEIGCDIDRINAVEMKLLNYICTK